VPEVSHASTTSVEPETQLGEIQELLTTARGWRFSRPKRTRPGSPGPRGLYIGEWIRRLFFLRFGVAFEQDLALLLFTRTMEGPREVRLRFEWHAPRLNADWRVFVHFLNEKGEIYFQADHPFGRTRDELGFLYYDLSVHVPAEVPSGVYAIRMGVWWPSQHRHLRVHGFRGARQERPGWCENAVYVGNCQIS
jgi:hypothetical protein